MRFLRLKIRLYPTIKQQKVIDDHFNGYRFAYNLCLEYKDIMWKQWKINKSGFDMQNELFSIRKDVEWLKLCKAECIREAALKLEKSFQKFYDGASYPKYKSKRNEQSFSAHQSISCKHSKLKFFRQKINFRTSKKYNKLLEDHKIKTVTFKKDKCKQYWATCLIEVKSLEHTKYSEKCIGIDLGIKSLITTSNGDVFTNNKYLISKQYKIVRLQRKFSKSKKGGCNREKIRLKIAKINRKCFRQKEHSYHQITNVLVKDSQTIVMEKLNIKGMMKNKNLARTISDASWYILLRQLEYKCDWRKVHLIKIGTFFPSSKTCSRCSTIKEKLLLSQRTYNCECCGLSIDRDLNAAINIRNEGLRISGLPVEDTINRLANEAGSKSLIINN